MSGSGSQNRQLQSILARWSSLSSGGRLSLSQRWERMTAGKKTDRVLLMAAIVALGVAVLIFPVSLLGMTSKTAGRAFGLSVIDAWLHHRPET